MATQSETFRQHIIEGGILDAPGVHHEFNAGMHGQKLDFDIIPDDSPLYNEWVQLGSEFVRQRLSGQADLIVGVANGTNRVAKDIGNFLGLVGLETAKDKAASRKLWLPKHAGELIAQIGVKLAVVIEDVGTTGSQSVQIAEQVKDAGAEKVVVVTTWQRRQRLEHLEEAGIEHFAIIKEPLPTYEPAECARTGFCAKGWELIPRPT